VRLAFSGHDRLDAGEADLATVLQAKGARIDHSGDLALTLRFEGASGRDRRTGRGRNQHQAARQRRHDKSAAPPCRSGHRFHHAARCRPNCCMLTISEKGLYPKLPC
jgi:hypothetical protein